MDETQKLPPPVTGRDLALILRRRAKLALATFVVVVGATVGLTSQMPRVYEAKARVLVDDPGRGAIPSSILELITPSRGTSLDTQIQMLRSRPVLNEVIRKGKLETRPEELRERLRLEAAPNGQVLDVGVRARTGEEAKKTANLLARIFVEVTGQQEKRAALQATANLRRTLEVADEEKAAAQNAVNNFMKSVGNANPIDFFHQRAALKTQIQGAIESDRKALQVEEGKRRELVAKRDALPETLITGWSQNKNPIIDGWRSQLYELQRKHTELLLDFTPESDEVRRVKAEMEALDRGIKRALNNQYSVGSKSEALNPDQRSAVSGVISSDVAIETLKASTRANEALLRRLDVEQGRLARDKGEYEDLLRLRDSSVRKSQQLRDGITAITVRRSTVVPSIRTFDPAVVPPAPVSPKPLLNTLMAVFLGAFLALAAALLAEYLDATGREDEGLGLPRVAGVPVLGSVPVSLPGPVGGELPVPAQASTRAEDALREVGYCLAHLRYAYSPSGKGTDGVPVVLLVGTRTDDTGAAIAAQLAATLVRDGLRVTLVDADRAHPRLNRVFGAPDAPGVADVLAGRAKADDILHKGADGNLRFLAAGSPEDETPTTERGLRALFKDLSTDTDLVLVSGPSAFHVPLVAPLQKAASGVVLVTPPGVPAGESVARARRLLTNGYQPHILGVVLSETPDTPAGWTGQAAKETA